jgi:alcohol dehydrogenase
VRALVLSEGGLRHVRGHPTPAPAPDEALVRVTLAGICNTDLELLRGYMGFRGVPGHEFAGVVERAAGHENWEGRRVVGEINAACGGCEACRAGRERHCPSRTVLGILGRDGAFAERLALPVRNLHAIPESVPDEEAVFAEPLAAACEVLEQVPVRPSDCVVVLGDGKLGLLCAQVLTTAGCGVTVVGHHPERFDWLRRGGIRTREERDVAGDAGSADLVVEATGRPEGFRLARRLVRPRGTVVLKSTYAGDIQADMTGLVVDEIT